MEPNHLVSVAALVTNEQGEILLVNSPWRGWEYPGGLIGAGRNLPGSVAQGTLQTSEESTEVIWATPKKAMEMITFPLTKKRLQNMLSGREEAALFCSKREEGFTVTEDQNYHLGK